MAERNDDICASPRGSGERPTAEGRRVRGPAPRGPLTFILSPLRGERTNSFRTPQFAVQTIV